MSKPCNNSTKGETGHADIWKQVIAPITLEDILKISNMSADDVRVPVELWVRVLLDYILRIETNWWRDLSLSIPL